MTLNDVVKDLIVTQWTKKCALLCNAQHFKITTRITNENVISELEKFYKNVRTLILITIIYAHEENIIITY